MASSSLTGGHLELLAGVPIQTDDAFDLQWSGQARTSTLNGAAVPGFVDARNKSGDHVGRILNHLYEAER
jgi:hypothetical protein